MVRKSRHQPRRPIWLVAGVAAIAALAVVGGVALYVWIAPAGGSSATISASQADAAGLAAATSAGTMGPGIAPATGWRVTGHRYVPTSDRLYDSSGRVVYSSSGGCFLWFGCSSGPVWVVEVASSEASRCSGTVVIDARSSRTRSAAIGCGSIPQADALRLPFRG